MNRVVIYSQKTKFEDLLLRYTQGEMVTVSVLNTFQDLVLLGYGEWAWSKAREFIEGKIPSKLHEFQEEPCLKLLAEDLIMAARRGGSAAGWRLEGGKVVTYGMFPKPPRRMCTCARR